MRHSARHATVEAANSWPLGLELIHPYIHTLDIKDFLWAQKDGKWQAATENARHSMAGFRTNMQQANGVAPGGSPSREHLDFVLPRGHGKL